MNWVTVQWLGKLLRISSTNEIGFILVTITQKSIIFNDFREIQCDIEFYFCSLLIFRSLNKDLLLRITITIEIKFIVWIVFRCVQWYPRYCQSATHFWALSIGLNKSRPNHVYYRLSYVGIDWRHTDIQICSQTECFFLEGVKPSRKSNL